MFYFNTYFNYNFWGHTYSPSIYCKDIRLSEHKNLEIEFLKENKIIGFYIDITFSHEDHAGPEFEFQLLGFGITFNFYDCRHWDYDKDQWYPKGKRLDED